MLIKKIQAGDEVDRQIFLMIDGIIPQYFES